MSKVGRICIEALLVIVGSLLVAVITSALLYR